MAVFTEAGLHNLKPSVGRIYTTGQVARLVKVAPRTVAKWFDAGRLRGYRIPGSNDRRIPYASLLRFLRENNLPLDCVEIPLPVVAIVGPCEIADAVCIALAGTDCDIALCPTGFDLGALAAKQIDAALIDCAIGRGEAICLVARLRSAWPQCRVILLACEDETDLTALGADCAFRSPCDPALVAVELGRGLEVLS